MALDFIDITQTRLSGVSHGSALQLDPKEPDVLRVVGVIDHMVAIRPKTQRDADKLRAWLDKHFPLRLPTYRPRRPALDSEPKGLLESDRDYVENNMDLAIALLDARGGAQPPSAPLTLQEQYNAAVRADVTAHMESERTAREVKRLFKALERERAGKAP